MPVGQRRPARAEFVRARGLRAAMQDDDQGARFQQRPRHVGQHAQVAGIAAKAGHLEQLATASVDAFGHCFRFRRLGQKFLPGAAIAAMTREIGEAGDCFSEHERFPFCPRNGERADFDQLADRQEHAVEKPRVGGAAPVGIEPGRWPSAFRQLVTLRENGPPPFRPRRKLHGGDGKAAAEPDAEQLAGQCPAATGIARLPQQAGQHITKTRPAGEQRQLRKVCDLAARRRARHDSGTASFAGQHRRQQLTIATDRIDRVRLPRRGHHPDQQVGGVVGGGGWRARPTRARRHQPAGDQ